MKEKQNTIKELLHTGQDVGNKIDIRKCFGREIVKNDLVALLTSDMNVFWSWGARGLTFLTLKNQSYGLRFAVSGHHHKGHVYIFLSSADLFDVYLTTNKGTIKKVITDLYFDQLVEVMDEAIERIAEYKR